MTDTTRSDSTVLWLGFRRILLSKLKFLSDFFATGSTYRLQLDPMSLVWLTEPGPVGYGPWW
jgi:hypothetical protein